jgi:hypothetical protein
MAKGKVLSNFVGIAAWITGVLVSLAVGFGMIGNTLTIPYFDNLWGLTVLAGWIVVVLTVISVVLAIIDRL